MNYWVIDGSCYKSDIKIGKDSVILSNGLVFREMAFNGCVTKSYKNLICNTEFIDKSMSDTAIVIAGNTINLSEFEFLEINFVERLKIMDFKPSNTMTEIREYPPAGQAIELSYKNDKLNLFIKVHYEIYNSIPTIMKQVFVTNNSTNNINIENIKTDILNITKNKDRIFFDSNFNALNFSDVRLDIFSDHYARYVYDILDFSPKYKMNIEVKPKETIASIISYETAFVAEYYEQKWIEIKTVYRFLAPWIMDSALFFHLISNSSSKLKKAVDQCAEVGAEMIIQSFGSGVRMQSKSDRYLNRIKRAYDYGHSKGIRMGAYTLAYVKNYLPIMSPEAINHDYSHICRCLATEWAQKYTKSIINFLDKTGADAIEIDGPYGMQLCSGGKTHLHKDFTDSQYKQWKLSIDDWYKQMKSRNIYINAPDWHFLNGTNRCPIGYEEIAFSEKRAEQLVVSRIYYYKGTFTRNPSQGWGFLPLNVYHGGGESARFSPTDKNRFEYDWALAQIVASGVWPTLRGTNVYDSEVGKEILKRWISVYKKHRQVLNGIPVHFLPPIINKNNPERTTCLDAIMTQNPSGEEKGFVMFFNQTDADIEKTVTIPVYYTGITNLETPPPPFPNTKNCDIEYPVYGNEISPLIIKERNGDHRNYVTDFKVIDKEIPLLIKPENTDCKITMALNGENPKEFIIDSNGNIRVQVFIPKMSYKWFIIK